MSKSAQDILTAKSAARIAIHHLLQQPYYIPFPQDVLDAIAKEVQLLKKKQPETFDAKAFTDIFIQNRLQEYREAFNMKLPIFSNFGWLVRSITKQEELIEELAVKEQLNAEQKSKKLLRMSIGVEIEKIAVSFLKKFFEPVGWPIGQVHQDPDFRLESKICGGTRYRPDFVSALKELDLKCIPGEVKTCSELWIGNEQQHVVPTNVPEFLEHLGVVTKVSPKIGTAAGTIWAPNYSHPYVLQGLLYAVSMESLFFDLVVVVTGGLWVQRIFCPPLLRSKLLILWWQVISHIQEYAVPEDFLRNSFVLDLLEEVCDPKAFRLFKTDPKIWTDLEGKKCTK